MVYLQLILQLKKQHLLEEEYPLLYNNLNNFVNLKEVDVLGCEDKKYTVFATDDPSVLSAEEIVKNI